MDMDTKPPPKNRARPAREDEAERENDGRKASQFHEAAHVGVGILEAVSKPIHVEDNYSSLHRVDEIAAVILKVVTVLALTFGLFEYDRQKADSRVTQSLNLVQEWESGGYQDAYARINDVLLPLYQQNADAIAAVGDNAAERALLYGNIGEAATGKDDNFVSEADRDADKVFHFFERAAICANEAICDYAVLKTFFGSEASSFWLYFGRYAERRQVDGYAGYGEWTHRVVDGEINRAKFLGIF
jgi:hypothetical protein